MQGRRYHLMVHAREATGEYGFFRNVVVLAGDEAEALARARKFIESDGSTFLEHDPEECREVTTTELPYPPVDDPFVVCASGRSLYTSRPSLWNRIRSALRRN